MTKDFIISTIAEIEGYPCDNMIGNVDIAEFMNEKCDKWCKKHCHENNKKKCWKKFFKEWYKAEKEKQLKLLESAGVSLETAEKVLQMSLFDNQPEVKQMSFADMSIDDICKLDENNKDHEPKNFEDIAKLVSNIEEMCNLIERVNRLQKDFESEVNK